MKLTESLYSPTSVKMSNNNNPLLNNLNRPFEDLGFISSGANDATTSRNTYLQPFDKFPSLYCTTGVGMTSSVGIPFTHAQWKELQRQALIYKCMISSVPVPSNLLFPLPAVESSASSILSNSMRYTKNGDPETGRCKRTDGKKWRCSRDVAPNQKYCEHHLRRGRSRSRKLVEAKNINAETHKKTRLQDNQLLSFNAKTDLSISATPSRNKTNSDLVISSGMEQRGKYLVESNMVLENDGSWNYGYTAAPDLNSDYNDLISRSTFPHVPEIGYRTEPLKVWSTDYFNNSNNNFMMSAGSSMSPNDGDLSPSLTLSMGIVARNVLDEEMGNIQMGSEIYSDKGKDCWEPFSGGGPLGEVLAIGSVPDSPYDSISSNPGTNVSSPSALATNPLEVTFKWLS